MNPTTKELISAQQRIQQIKEMAILSEQAGLDIFVLGESHQDGFVSQAHAIILAAIVEATNTIKVSSGSTIVSTSDPVRIFENFATLDLLSNGRIELIGGRASRIGLFKLLGYDLNHYEELFEEKFNLLLKLNQEEYVTWNGEFRAPLDNAHIIPRPVNQHLPIWRAVGGGSGSAARAGHAGVPMTLAMLSGPASIFKRIIDIYRESAKQNGFDETTLPVTTGGFFHIAKDMDTALKEYYPHINHGFTQSNGQNFPKQAFAHARDPKSIINVGEVNQVIEKILYQHDVFGHQRYIAQLDFGGMPYDKIMANIEVLGTHVLPAVRKYTAK